MSKMTSNIEKVDAKPQKTSWGYLITMTLVLVLAGVSHRLGQFPTIRNFRPRSNSTLQEKFHQKVLEEEQKFQRKNNEVTNDFQFRLQEILNRNFSAAESRIPAVVKDLSGFGACNKLCYKMAADKIKGTSTAETAIENALSKVLNPCAAGTAEVDCLLKEYETRLTENCNEFRSSIAATLKNPEFINLNSSAIEKLTEEMAQIHLSVSRTIISTVAAEVGAGLELVFIRSTCRIITSVLAKTVGKLSGSATIGTICAVADGPLPIGDVIGGGIAVVGLGWTAWDIHQATKVLPGKLSKQLHESVRNYRSELNRNANAQAQKLLDEYRKSAKELVEAAKL